MTDATRDRWMPRSGVLIRRGRAAAEAEQERKQAAIDRGDRRPPRERGADEYGPGMMPGSLGRGFR